MRTSILYLGCFLFVMACSGGGGGSSSSSPPPQSACEINNTGTLIFANTSAQGTIDFYYDATHGSRLEPGTSSSPVTLAAGAYAARYINVATNTNACTPTTLTINRCTTFTSSCNGGSTGGGGGGGGGGGNGCNPNSGFPCNSNGVCCPRGLVGCRGNCYPSVGAAYSATLDASCLSVRTVCPP